MLRQDLKPKTEEGKKRLRTLKKLSRSGATREKAMAASKCNQIAFARFVHRYFGTTKWPLPGFEPAAKCESKPKPKHLTPSQQRVYGAIVEASDHGVTADELLERYAGLVSYSGITARFSELLARGLIKRGPDKREGKSGSQQAVLRKAEANG